MWWMRTSCENALGMLQNMCDNKSTLVPAMAWCHQATSHYLSQCCVRSIVLLGQNELTSCNIELQVINWSNWFFFDNQDDICTSWNTASFTLFSCNNNKTRYVNSTPTFEVTPVTTQYIHPPYHGNTRSMSWSWMDDSHALHSMSISPPKPELNLFQTLTLKLRGQVQGCGQRASSYNPPCI